MRRWIPLFMILGLMVLAYVTDVRDYFTFTEFKEYRQVLLHFVEGHYLAAIMIFMGLYVVSTALSMPVGIYLSIFGGFLFGQPWSTFYVVFGATLGACLLFLAAKTAFGDLLRKRAGPFLKRFEKGFQENAAHYMLFLRLVPLFPFWLVNLAPAFLEVRLRVYVWTTFVGIMPGAFVFTQFGTGLGSILDRGETFSLGMVLTPEVWVALIALGIFVLIPVVVKRVKEL